MTTIKTEEVTVDEVVEEPGNGELTFDLLANDNLGFTRQIVAKTEEGETIVLVDLYANITDSDLSQTTNYTVNVVNKKLVTENREAVQAQVDAFLADIRRKVESIDLVSL